MHIDESRSCYFTLWRKERRFRKQVVSRKKQASNATINACRILYAVLLSRKKPFCKTNQEREREKKIETLITLSFVTRNLTTLEQCSDERPQCSPGAAENTGCWGHPPQTDAQLWWSQHSCVPRRLLLASRSRCHAAVTIFKGRGSVYDDVIDVNNCHNGNATHFFPPCQLKQRDLEIFCCSATWKRFVHCRIAPDLLNQWSFWQLVDNILRDFSRICSLSLRLQLLLKKKEQGRLSASKPRASANRFWG